MSKAAAENFSANVTKSEQYSYIKIETLCGNIVCIIYTPLKEVCGNATMDRSTVQQLHKRFREGKVSVEDKPSSGHPSTKIDSTSTAILAIVLDKDQRIMVRDIRSRNWHTTNYSSPYFDWTSGPEKKGYVVGTTCTAKWAKTNKFQNHSRTFKMVQMRRKFFGLNNCYPRDMSMGFRAWILNAKVTFGSKELRHD